MLTLKVVPTQAGDQKYFVLTQAKDGSRLVDAMPYAKLTAAQKRMVTE